MGNYTLVVRSGGMTNNVRINCCDGQYGFVDISMIPRPPTQVEFPSVPDFVEYFKDVSLKKFIPDLDVTLIHPHSRFVVRLNSM